MAGVKTFVNRTPATLQFILFVRQGQDPVNTDGTVSFILAPNESRVITYGNDQNVFLNGVAIFSQFAGELYNKVQFVIERSGFLDNLLNTSNTIDILLVLSDFVMSGRNV